MYTHLTLNITAEVAAPCAILGFTSKYDTLLCDFEALYRTCEVYRAASGAAIQCLPSSKP